MYQDHTEPPPALTPFELTYCPAYKPSGAPINPQASRQELQERRTAVVEALSSEAATDRFERDQDRMVTGCTRVQFDQPADAVDPPQRPYRVEADWHGGGFGYTAGFASAEAAAAWGQAKAKHHAGAVVSVTARGGAA